MARRKTNARKTSRTRAESRTTEPKGEGQEGHGVVLR
jgi:hypothetical protein